MLPAVLLLAGVRRRARAACPRIEVMIDERHADLAGVELASELLPDGRQVLLAFLVRGEDGGEALELGVWDVAGQGRLARPARPLLLPVGEVDRARRLAERVVAALPHLPCSTAGAAVLGREGRLEAMAVPAPDGTLQATFGWTDAGARLAVPAAAVGSVVRARAEAERALAELGLVAPVSPAPGP
jgi:hypothetical protein